MKKWTKAYLALSVAAFVCGALAHYYDVELPPAWAVLAPLGVVFLGLFLISLMLEEEVAAFDKEERTKRIPAAGHISAGGPPKASDSRPLHELGSHTSTSAAQTHAP
ncbi:MAG: hypothetical protein KGR98_06650 [Verrucomicrobia bacterium]|nr:hypothetical protein [Verrucomicrobiota bacterium]MDE3097860.1 hypothetical protein [Verrucomicrobiota bacterium]